MTPDSDDKLIETLLSQDEAIPDNGFTAGVMEALPPKRSRSRQRPIILGGFSIVACLLGFFLLPADNFLWTTFQEVATWNFSAVSLVTVLSLLTLAVWGAVSAATSEV